MDDMAYVVPRKVGRHSDRHSYLWSKPLDDNKGRRQYKKAYFETTDKPLVDVWIAYLILGLAYVDLLCSKAIVDVWRTGKCRGGDFL